VGVEGALGAVGSDDFADEAAAGLDAEALFEGVAGGADDPLVEVADEVARAIDVPAHDPSFVGRVLEVGDQIARGWGCSPVAGRRAKASRPRFAAGARVTPAACSRAPPPA